MHLYVMDQIISELYIFFEESILLLVLRESAGSVNKIQAQPFRYVDSFSTNSVKFEK